MALGLVREEQGHGVGAPAVGLSVCALASTSAAGDCNRVTAELSPVLTLERGSHLSSPYSGVLSLHATDIGGWIFPGGSVSKESACNVGDAGSIPGSGRSPGGGHGKPTPVFWPAEIHGQRSLEGYSPWVREEWDTTEQLLFTHVLCCGGCPLRGGMLKGITDLHP